jgi:hypothetical protein
MAQNDNAAWAAVLYPVHREMQVFGAKRGSLRLHWKAAEARKEAEGWAEILGHQISWEMVDDLSVVGRVGEYAVILRKFLLPAPEQAVQTPKTPRR